MIPAVRPPFFHHRQDPLARRGALPLLISLVGKVILAVVRIFLILCCRRRQPEQIGPFPPGPLQIEDFEPAAPIAVEPVPEGAQAAGAVQVAPMPLAPDRQPHPNHAAALDEARQYLRGGIGARQAAIGRLTARDFITLYHEFPGQRNQIIRWSIASAQMRAIKIDPAHPFFEIFQQLLRDRNRYGGGGEPGNYQNYEVAAYYSGNDGREYYNQTNKFVYTVYSLIGFQELTRAENREWIRLIDNGRATFDENPAYQFGRALSKIFIYPTRPQNFEYRGVGRQPMDIRDKIHHGINIPWNAYATAKTMNEVPLFFEQCFGSGNYNEHCFDARVSSFQKFMERYLAHPDFTPEIGLRHDINHRALEHYKACKNQMIMKFAQENNLIYRNFKAWVDQFGSNGIPAVNDLNPPLAEADRIAANAQIQAFFEQFRPETFADYLAQGGQPLKTMVQVYDAHYGRQVLKPQGPVLQRAPRVEEGVPVEGWEEVLKRNGVWPDDWDMPARPAAAPGPMDPPAMAAPAAQAPAAVPDPLAPPAMPPVAPVGA